ncbi:hypothetical protein KIN20_003811 [Parelaphostrongylus tenuis]|uniref:HMG box domain-containing protein n=1 Tax=Parelaphostrongylus tenuis TaxID=148309 RepID=A0AAD5M251_PARTN|nr:hypothetical protein KIN20_003811 [Parelaphostrongylus tenuis]
MAKAAKKRSPATKGCKSKQGGKVAKESDPNAPKRAMSAFFFWMADNRDRIKKPGMGVAEVAKAAGVEWRKVADKSKWEKKAAEDKKRYESEMAAYKASEFFDGDFYGATAHYNQYFHSRSNEQPGYQFCVSGLPLTRHFRLKAIIYVVRPVGKRRLSSSTSANQFVISFVDVVGYNVDLTVD